MRLQDQVILITGSTTGIGEHMARRFIQEGARVILHGRDAARGEALRQELGADKAEFCQGSLEDAAYPEKLAADALAAFGRVDALVNNAALTIRGRIDTTDAAFFDRMMAVNARAPMLLIRALLPELKKNTGVVLNIGSVLAHCGQANMLAYSMSKGAVHNLSAHLDALGAVYAVCLKECLPLVQREGHPHALGQRFGLEEGVLRVVELHVARLGGAVDALDVGDVLLLARDLDLRARRVQRRHQQRHN
jgi:NAD(P)-dependent dehydrogenase (short-subunit alcohol dehydrogenase family)